MINCLIEKTDLLLNEISQKERNLDKFLNEKIDELSKGELSQDSKNYTFNELKDKYGEKLQKERKQLENFKNGIYYIKEMLSLN